MTLRNVTLDTSSLLIVVIIIVVILIFLIIIIVVVIICVGLGFFSRAGRSTRSPL